MNLADRLRNVVRPGGSAWQDPPYVPHPNAAAALGTPRRPGSADPSCTSADPANTDRIADTLGGEWREAQGRSASADRPASAGVSDRAATRPRYLVIDRRYPADHRLGRVAVADCLPAADGLWPQLELLMCGASGAGALRERLLFVDLETTGLAGGAGTYAFLIGCGWFEGAAFRVRQFFLTSYAAERGLLDEVAGTMGAAGALVTYNGKTFDMPLIDTRFLFHRLVAPFSGLPHLDMLHAARRLWSSAETGGSASQNPPYVRRPGSAEPAAASAAVRRSGPPSQHCLVGSLHDPTAANMRRSSCRLTMVEQAVLGHVREGDVPGFEIPSRYFHYVRTGDARPLASVMEHNRLDLLALAMLTATAARLLEDGASGARTAREALGLGRLYERGGLIAQARACFARAAGAGADLPASTLALRRGHARAFGEGGKVGPYDDEGGESLEADAVTRAEALRAYAVLCRRARQYEEAADAWRRVLALRGCPPHLAQEATEALAVHHEHRLRDLRSARQFAMQALQFPISTRRVEAGHHRLARIDRKLACPERSRRSVPPPEPAPLF